MRQEIGLVVDLTTGTREWWTGLRSKGAGEKQGECVCSCCIYCICDAFSVKRTCFSIGRLTYLAYKHATNWIKNESCFWQRYTLSHFPHYLGEVLVTYWWSENYFGINFNISTFFDHFHRFKSCQILESWLFMFCDQSYSQ